MAIEIRTSATGSYACIVCDTCGEYITDPQLAMVAWERPSSPDLFFCHKGKCDRRPDAYWHELTTFLVQLLHNSGFRRKHMKHEIFCERMGRL